MPNLLHTTGFWSRKTLQKVGALNRRCRRKSACVALLALSFASLVLVTAFAAGSGAFHDSDSVGGTVSFSDWSPTSKDFPNGEHERIREFILNFDIVEWDIPIGKSGALTVGWDVSQISRSDNFTLIDPIGSNHNISIFIWSERSVGSLFPLAILNATSDDTYRLSSPDGEQIAKFAGTRGLTEMYYPFDEFSVRLILRGIAPESGEPILITSFLLSNPHSSQWDFKPSLESYLSKPLGTASKNGIQSTIEIIARRQSIIKMSAILIVALNWCATLAVLYATVAYSWGDWKIIPGTDSVMLPFTALFALPAVRGVMPDSPPVGCMIDLYGIIPNLVILIACAVVHIILRLHRQNQESSFPSKDSSNRESQFAKSVDDLENVSMIGLGRA